MFQTYLNSTYPGMRGFLQRRRKKNRYFQREKRYWKRYQRSVIFRQIRFLQRASCFKIRYSFLLGKDPFNANRLALQAVELTQRPHSILQFRILSRETSETGEVPSPTNGRIWIKKKWRKFSFLEIRNNRNTSEDPSLTQYCRINI